MSGSRSGDGGGVEIYGDSSPSSRPCAFCLQDVGQDPSTSCPKCKAVYHPDCWAANDRKCAIYGCVPAPAPVPERPRVVPVPVVARATSSPGSNTSRNATIIAVIIVANALRFCSTSHPPRFSSVPEIRTRSFEIDRLRTITLPRSDDQDISEATLLLELNPTNAKPYFARGAAFQRKGDLPAALLDFDKAIELDPNGGPAYHSRGHVRVQLNDLEGAVADFSKAWELDPREPEPIYDRACVSYDLQAWEASVKDFALAYERIPSLRSYCQLRFCLARSRMGQRTAAEKDLAVIVERTSNSRDPWIEELLRFVAGLSNEETLFAEAEREPDGRLCQANFYAGTLRLLEGDEAQARMYFSNCLQTGSKEYREFASAAAELRALDAKK